MKKIISIIALLILPILFSVFLYKHKTSYGEYYLSRNYDPSYPYLINSLNLAQFSGYGVGLINHPGTTVQELGTVVILLFHSIRSGNGDLVNDVLAEPEYYLHKIFLTFLLMYFTSLLVLGITVFSTLKNLKAALFLQLTPFAFYSEDALFQMVNICVEPLLVITNLLLISLIIIYVHKSENSDKPYVLPVLFGLICSIALATKISFFPVLIIPFLLIRQFRYKLIFILITMIGFLIFVSPAFSLKNAGEFFTWVKDLVTHSGKYGTGKEDIVESTYYIENIKTIFRSNLIFGLSYILLWTVFIMQFFNKFRSLIRENRYYHLITGILTAMTLQILIVAKHFSLYYMIPVFMFSILSLFMVNTIILSVYHEKFKNKKKINAYIAFVSLILCVLFFFMYKPLRKKISHIGNGRNEAREIINSLETDHKNSIVISTYECSNKVFALYLGVFYAGTQKDRYMEIIKNKYPRSFCYNRWDNRFYEEWDYNYIRTQLLKENSFYFQGFNEEVLQNFMKKIREMTNKPEAEYEKIMTNYTGEALYKISLK